MDRLAAQRPRGLPLAGRGRAAPELRVSALEDLIEARLSVGEHAEVWRTSSGSSEHPLRERLWGHLMLARYRSGRQADALDAFRQAQDLLADELGIDPSTELQELQRRILQQSDAAAHRSRSAATDCSSRWARARSASSGARSTPSSDVRSA